LRFVVEDVYSTGARFLQHLQTQAANVDTYKSESDATSEQIAAIKDDANYGVPSDPFIVTVIP